MTVPELLHLTSRSVIIYSSSDTLARDPVSNLRRSPIQLYGGDQNRGGDFYLFNDLFCPPNTMVQKIDRFILFSFFNIVIVPFL